MKVYITTRFQGKANKQTIHELSHAVREAKMDDFWFIRDVEHYKRPFHNPKEKWAKIYDEIAASDMLLLDISSSTSSRRTLEMGIAFALKKPVIIAVKRGLTPTKAFTEIASTVIEYDTYKDIIKPLKKYDTDRNFTMTDKTMLFAAVLLFGIASGWGLAQYFVPLGLIWIVIYWWAARRLLPTIRAFDRVAIYIPLAALWAVGMYIFAPVSPYLLWGWIVGFWFAVLVVLQKMKFSL